jgi:hypothetical protein
MRQHAGSPDWQAAFEAAHEDKENEAVPKASAVAAESRQKKNTNSSTEHQSKLAVQPSNARTQTKDTELLKTAQWACGLPAPSPGLLQRLHDELTEEQARDLVLAYNKQQNEPPAKKTPRRSLLGGEIRRTSLLRHRLALAKVFVLWAKEQGFDPQKAPRRSSLPPSCRLTRRVCWTQRNSRDHKCL